MVGGSGWGRGGGVEIFGRARIAYRCLHVGAGWIATTYIDFELGVPKVGRWAGWGSGGVGFVRFAAFRVQCGGWRECAPARVRTQEASSCISGLAAAGWAGVRAGVC